MAFSNFSHISQVQKKYQVAYREDNFIVTFHVPPSAELVEAERTPSTSVRLSAHAEVSGG